MRKPRVFVDVDVLFAGAAAPSEHGASLTILRMAEITLIEALDIIGNRNACHPERVYPVLCVTVSL